MSLFSWSSKTVSHGHTSSIAFNPGSLPVSLWKANIVLEMYIIAELKYENYLLTSVKQNLSLFLLNRKQN